MLYTSRKMITSKIQKMPLAELRPLRRTTETQSIWQDPCQFQTDRDPTKLIVTIEKNLQTKFHWPDSDYEEKDFCFAYMTPNTWLNSKGYSTVDWSETWHIAWKDIKRNCQAYIISTQKNRSSVAEVAKQGMNWPISPEKILPVIHRWWKCIVLMKAPIWRSHEEAKMVHENKRDNDELKRRFVSSF
jgi:hypothetical protein